ncbi:uncharacterized protein LOC122403531 isoform X2 [Colletes gigas]|uniref:uncharacterized protein LOC122403531 isoform X2 n=1 Tax=Colletes gigas TaxID=935657 RepID=UPI001C9A5DB7|nr:uncharacterized protein LOC122403531 isoform X2 [Colletes gigas]XP_043263026.1 uncharacterized protein LOC122403531 isoform X2 [Colletes gigas]XP_043263027.1 uncharacterized protein LOC122403531 isoform X2 [Colletes gigas]
MDYRSAGTRCEDDSLENEKGVGAAANDHKGSSKRGGSHTRGTAMSFGFRRRPASGIPMPITNYTAESSLLHPRSKSAGPEQNRRRDDDDDGSCAMRNSSSGRSTPRLAPPKKEASGIAVRTNRFGYRQPQAKFTNKVGDICSSHTVSHYNQEKMQQHQQDSFGKQPHRVVQVCNAAPASKIKQAPVQNTVGCNNVNTTYVDGSRRPSGIPEPFGRYTLHTSHLPLPQYAVRMTDANSKIAKTVANQSRKVSAASKSSTSSKEGSSTEDSGVGSQQGCREESELRGVDYTDSVLSRRHGTGRPRNLRMVVNGKSFDVRDVRDDDSTVTEISVIPLPKTFVTAATGLVRERTTQYQRIVNKDNRYTESTTSMSTTSSEGYDEGLGEEKVYKDRSHSEKIPSIKSDFSPPSSDDPEYGHGEAMADEYSLSSSDECHRSTTIQHLQIAPNTAKNGTVPKSALRSVLLTIEDPAFAAAAATSTSMIDDETSPVDSLFDSLTASITQSDAKAPKKEQTMEQSGNDDDSPGTPTNASNSLSLSESREFFDDEIADQPGLVFDDNSRGGGDTQSAIAGQVITDNSHTLVESSPKTGHGKNSTNSPHHGKRISRAGSVDTLSPCESIASDDLILDYEQSDASSYEEQNRVDSNTALQDMDDATILSELEAQGEEVMRQWTSLLGTCQTLQQTNNSNTINNNVNNGSANNNNQSTNEIGNECDKTAKVWRSRSVTDSPRSLDGTRNRQFSSPLRTSRNVQSPSIDSGDERSLRVDRDTYQHMFQDIVSIKTMLLKLKRVLQESEENGLTRAETLNPFDNSIKNGLFYNLNEGGTADVSTSPGSGGSSIADELADLRRQVVFLQGQVEDRDRTIQVLQFQMSKLQGSNGVDGQSCALTNNRNTIPSVNTYNAATQTERTRPVSAGPSLLQTLPQDGVMGPLVSHVRWSDSWDQHRPTLLTELNGNRSLRKVADRIPRTIRSRQEETSHRQNGHTDKLLIESPLSRKTLKSKDSKSSESNDMEQREIKTEGSPTKSCIPTARKLATSTLIPRSARALTSTGRSHNL